MGLPDGISIVICTYNGAGRIRPTLESIFALKNEKNIPWELIIIDNASTDQTADLCRELIEKNGFQNKSRIVFEKNPGCNHARLRGLRETRYKWLLFCDDDNHLMNDYLQTGWEILEQHPDIGVLGGQGIALFEKERPLWFDHYHRSFAVGPQAKEDGRINNRFTKLYSAGSFFRTEALTFFYDHHFSTIMVGPLGNDLTRGEDTEWCFLIQLKGYELWYSGRLRFYHFMTSARMTWSYYLRLKQGISSGVAKLEAYTLFFQEQNPTTLSFIWHYIKRCIFYNLVWLQFICKIKLRLQKYTPEVLDLGYANNQTKAAAFRKDFSVTFRHFKQIKRLLPISR